MRRFLSGFILGVATAWGIAAALTEPPQTREAGLPERQGRWCDVGHCTQHHAPEAEGCEWREDRVTCTSETLTPEIWHRYKHNPGRIEGTRYPKPVATTAIFHQHWISDEARAGLPVA